jgi:hypothetical protein
VVTGAALEEEPEEEPLDDEPLEPEPLDGLAVEDPPEPALDEAACAEVAADAAAAEAFAFTAAACFAAAVCVALVEVWAVAVWDVAVLAGRLLAPRAGSCPVTRCTKIATQRATNMERVIAATRRRMPRVRSLRAQTRWRARRRPSSGGTGGEVEIGVCMRGSIAPRRESAVGPS